MEQQELNMDNGLLYLSVAVGVILSTAYAAYRIIRAFQGYEDMSTANSAESYSRSMNKSEK